LLKNGEFEELGLDKDWIISYSVIYSLQEENDEDFYQ